VLTIGIPTYNRKSHVISRVKFLCDNNLPADVRLLVVDDGSSDGTAEALSKLGETYQILDYTSHGTNKGYSAAFLELFKRCKTPYLMVSCDDDDIIVSNISKLLSDLRTGEPNMLSTQFLFEKEIGRCNKMHGEIRPRDFFGCSALAPGLVYRVQACQNGLSHVQKLLRDGSEIAALYPQVLVVASALCLGRCFWWPKALVRAGARLPTGIRGANGEQYHHVTSRWRQLRELEIYFTELLSVKEYSQCYKKIGEMRQANRERIYGALRTAIEAELPQVIGEFDKSIKRHSLRLYARDMINRLMAILNRKPG
jgi:hypothetical protein